MPSKSEKAQAIQHFLTNQIATYGYPAVFLLMLAGSACIPVPSEIVMVFGGALAANAFTAQVLSASNHHLMLLAVVLVGVLGSMAGSWLAYWIGYAGGRPLIDRWGRYLLFRPHEVDRAHAWFERRGEALVFFGRLVPLVRAFVSLPAGVARMSFAKFSLYTFLGIVPWTLGFALAGYEMGDNWRAVEPVMRPVSIVVALVAVAALAWWVGRRVMQARQGT